MLISQKALLALWSNVKWVRQDWDTVVRQLKHSHRRTLILLPHTNILTSSLDLAAHNSFDMNNISHTWPVERSRDHRTIARKLWFQCAPSIWSPLMTQAWVMERGEHRPHKSCIKHARGRITLGEMVQWKQQQMNEGSGGRGEIPRQDSNVTGKDMKRRFIISSEGKVEGWMAFKLVASSSRLSLCSRTHKEITGGRY